MPDELRNPLVALEGFRLAVGRMLELPRDGPEPLRITNPPNTDNSRPIRVACATSPESVAGKNACDPVRVADTVLMLSSSLKVVFPVEDAGSFASLLRRIDEFTST